MLPIASGCFVMYGGEGLPKWCEIICIRVNLLSTNAVDLFPHLDACICLGVGDIGVV